MYKPNMGNKFDISSSTGFYFKSKIIEGNHEMK